MFKTSTIKYENKVYALRSCFKIALVQSVSTFMMLISFIAMTANGNDDWKVLLMAACVIVMALVAAYGWWKWHELFLADRTAGKDQ